MSSFKDKVARAEKQKGGRATKKGVQPDASPPEEYAEGAPEQTQVPTADTNVVMEEAPPGNTGEFYGEDQEDSRGNPKWERTIPLDRLRPNPYQPRKTFDPAKLDELADGMREHGWIGGGLPVRAHTTEANTYELVWGERRWRAAGLAGLKAIPCVVSIYTDDDMIEKGLLENIQREDLTNLEEGQAYVNLLALRTDQKKPRYSIRRLAKAIGKDKSYIEERLKYARVPVDIQQLAVDHPDISPRIIHELGELSKLLQLEERESVIEGVREGRLRIEDVREIRQDVEQAKNEVTIATVPEPSTPVEQLRVQQPIPLPVATSGAIDTLLPTTQQEEQPPMLGQEPTPLTADVPSQEQERDTPAPASPLAAAVAVSVFEKTLKRDNETVERIFQRLATIFESLTGPEQRVFLYYLRRWDVTIQGFISKLEPEEGH